MSDFYTATGRIIARMHPRFLIFKRKLPLARFMLSFDEPGAAVAQGQSAWKSRGKLMNIWTKRIVAVAAWSAVSSSAMAGTVFCPETNSAELVRTISVISDSANDSGFADCFAYGTGNIPSSGDVQFDIPPPAQPSYEVLFSRDQTTVYNWLDTFNVGTGNTNGLISWADNVITISDLFAGYTNLLVLVKVGGGTGDPDWATFTMTGGDLTLGTSIVGGTGGGVSHVAIYGNPPSQVPEPMTLTLLGAGLLGLGLARRRKA
jgi:hypothetical protein